MPEGTIKKPMDKGFGFNKTDGFKDLFFHSKNFQGVSFDQLHEGQKVTLHCRSGAKRIAGRECELA